MQFEVSVALNFMIAYLYNKLPRRRVNMFGEQMIEHIRIKFQGHWYPERPTKGSAYRSIRISKEKVDRVIINAAIDVGLDLQEILDTLPNDLTIWIDPGEVSYRIGEKGSVQILYEDERRLLRKHMNKDRLNSESSSDSEETSHHGENLSYMGSISLHDTSNSFPSESTVPIHPFNPDAQIFLPIDTVSINDLLNSSSILNEIPLSSSTTMDNVSSNSTFSNKTTPVLSAQTFAQTKFGSLRNKHCGRKNQTKMLSNEFSAYIKQKEQIQQSKISPPSSAIIRPYYE